MKKTFNILLLFFWLCATTSCMAQGRLYREASEMNGVECIYLSKAMCRMGTGIANLNELGDGVLSLDGMEVMNCDDEKDMPKLKQLIDREISESKAELWVAMNGSGEDVAIYAIPETEESLIARQLYILNNDGKSLQFISMKGKFDLQKITAGQ